jgi:hypothetical protein
LKQISVFDADACIFMGRPISSGLSLLSEVLEVFDENYMHKTVYDEIKKTRSITDAKTHLISLEAQGIIEIIDDSILLDILCDELNGNEEAGCRYFCESLKNNINRMQTSKKNNLLALYNSVLNSTYTKKIDLIKELNTIETALPKATSIGEVKTCVLVEVLDFLSLSNINFFVSNDKKARKLMVQANSGKINTSSPMGTFILLRNIGIDKGYAAQYFRNTPKDKKLKVLNKVDEEVLKDNSEIFDDIYDEEKNVVLTSIGMIKYQ